MYTDNVRKYLTIALVVGWVITLVYFFLGIAGKARSRLQFAKIRKSEIASLTVPTKPIDNALVLLRKRKDKDALVILDKILLSEPNNIDARWAKAEVFRRAHQYKVAELIFNEVLNSSPDYAKALISLSYIRYRENKLKEALGLVNSVLDLPNLDNESKALAFSMQGLLYGRRLSNGEFTEKINFGALSKDRFLKALDLAPNLAEVHANLGRFYLLAPIDLGGDLNMAFNELELAVAIAPDFATSQALLAKAYKKKGDIENYNIYFKISKGLDPKNEIVLDIENNR